MLLPYHCVFISTHSLTKRLTCFQTRDRDIQQISTHSLTKRLTDFLFDFVQNINYFNSQPHEEADGNIKKVGFRSGHFNSQPHEEADEAEARLRGRRNISTHSLTKRLTIDVVALRCTDVFQLTASRRG